MQMTGKELHDKVEHLREDGHPEESIKLAEEAKKAYISENNMLGLSDLYGSISLSYRHLNDLNNAKKAAEESVKIARENNLKGDLARPLFNVAKVQEESGELNEAIKSYGNALKVFQEENPKLHNRTGVLADMKIHLAVCEYKNGDKTALNRIHAAIDELKVSDEKTVSKYNYDVWLSGAYLKLAELLKNKEYLNKAKEIIDSNPELKIRKEQWEKLAQNF